MRLHNVKKEQTNQTLKTMRKLLVIFCAVFLLVACDNNIVISETKSLPNGWDKNEAISFTLPQLDTLKAYNMFINIRNSNDYPYNNLFLVASIEFRMEHGWEKE